MQPPVTDPMRYLILGTAGHIDHGKTRLVHRLTGIDTDRLPEEKRRGITIDLGFANLDLEGVRLGVVDVPGHERFVHNMVAGATGVDLAMLVVAADDSVMPQTIEHLAILELLGIQLGLVAVTKIDLVDSDHLALVIEELSELLRGTFLAGAPVVPVSSETGQGLEDLKAELGRLAAGYVRPTSRQVFRMPIDRVFTIQGHGTVVTGTVLSGQAAVGETLHLMPQNRGVRVRRLQSHSDEVPLVRAGQRAAINLAGVKHDELRRGDELTVEGYLQPSRRLLTRVRTLSSAARVLEDRQLLRLHAGTREVTVRAILKGARLEPNQEGFVELRSREPLLLDYGQRFILRQLSPVVTAGGGIVLDPAIESRQRLRDLAGLGAKLAQADPLERLSAYLEDHDVEGWRPESLACRLGIDPNELPALIGRLSEAKRLVRLAGTSGMLMHKARRKSLGDAVLVLCHRELRRRAPSRALERTGFVMTCRRLAQPEVIDAMIEDLLARGLLVRIGDRIGPPELQVQLTRNQQRWHEQLVAACREGGLSPPLLPELARTVAQSAKELTALAELAVDERLLVRVAEELYFDPAALETARQRTVERIRQHGPATVADLRDAWGVTRKYAVPLCEYFDTIGVTTRVKDQRGLGPHADVPVHGG